MREKTTNELFEFAQLIEKEIVAQTSTPAEFVIVLALLNALLTDRAMVHTLVANNLLKIPGNDNPKPN